MDPTVTPSPDDVNLFIVIVHQVSTWWRAFITGGFVICGSLIWRASSKYTAAELSIKDHAERIGKSERAIRALESGQQVIALKLESLPTRTEMSDQFRSVRDDIRAVVSGRGGEAHRE